MEEEYLGARLILSDRTASWGFNRVARNMTREMFDVLVAEISDVEIYNGYLYTENLKDEYKVLLKIYNDDLDLFIDCVMNKIKGIL